MSSEAVDLFEGMTAQARSKISRAGIEESHPAGDFLFHAGDRAENLFVLRKGRVRLGIGPEARVAHILSNPGEAIGWSSMVGNHAYSASAECLGPVTVVRYHKDRLNQILEEDPACGLAFFRRLAKYIGVRLLESYGGMLSLQGKPGHRPYEHAG